MRGSPDTAPRTGLDLLEESANLLHHAPARLLAAYFAGTAPFAMGLIYFAARLSRGLDDGGFVAAGSLGLALLFLWMKCWHAVFASGLARHLRNEPAEPWSASRVARLAATQAVLQPSGLLAIPLALLVLLPFGRIHAYYQNLAVLGDGRPEVEDVRRRAWSLAGAWPRQNLTGMWAFSPWFFLAGMGAFALTAWGLSDYLSGDSPFMTVLLLLYGFFLFAGILSPLPTLLAINAAALLIAGPFLLDRWFGIRTAFTLAGVFGIVNSTFLLAVSAIALMLIDPFMKSFYVLRCFYAGSRTSGEDLLVDWRMRARARSGSAALLLLLAAAPPAATAAEVPAPRGTPAAAVAEAPSPGPAAGDLDAALDRVLERSEYRWRLPPPPDAGEEDPGAVTAFFRGVREWLKDIVRRLEDWFTQREARGRTATAMPGGGGRTLSATKVLIVLAVALALAAAILVIRRRRATEETITPTVVSVVPARPDLADERIRADLLPTDEWIALSREMRARGEWRKAVRALFLSQLAWLAQQRLVRLSPGRSNRDYVRDLQRRRQALADLPDRFSDNVSVFERVWYGRDAADETLLDRFEEAVRLMRGGGHA